MNETIMLAGILAACWIGEKIKNKMGEIKMYKTLKEIQKKLWENGGDRMDQVTLFELQDMVAELTLQAARKEGKVNDLLKEFKFLYIVD
jgi:hypothetical protein